MSVPDIWIRSEVDRVAVSEGCYFDESAGAHVCEFVEEFCVQSKGRWGGEKIRLLDWQRDFLMRLFGWKRADGTRRYRRAYVEIAKKNGKSTLISAIELYLLVADGENAPEVYCNATDRSQASIVFDEAARMVRASPDLSAMLEIVESKKRIVCEENNGVILANSKEVDAKDGLNPSGVVFDELHRQPDRKLWEVFEYAGDSRDQPIVISITTAGEDDQGVWYEQREYSEKVNAGIILDTSHLGIVYRALETDDINDPATWRKANPSLGATINEAEFARQLEEAKRVPSKLSNFKRLKLNLIAREADKFVDMAAWDRGSKALKLSDFAGEPCWGGLDLSSVNDLTALAFIFGDRDEGFAAFLRFYLPEDNIVELEHKHRFPYRMWADQGFITLTDGASVDYGFVRSDIIGIAADHDLRKLLADPYNATQLLSDLQDHDGLPVDKIRQGDISLNSPTKEFDRLIRAGKIRHGGNPVLRWMASNAVATVNENENIRLSKKKSRLKIDGVAALVNAIAAATEGDDDSGPSVYEDRGLLCL